MSWRDARRLSDAMYTEVAFQSIYGLRQGNALSERTEPSAAVARTRVSQSKLLISLLLALVALAVPTLLGRTVERVAAPYLPPGLYTVSVFAALLVLDLALIWWTGLQVLPALLGAKVQPLAETLPVDDRTLDRAALLTLLRLFDAPLGTVLIVTPVVVGVALGSPIAALAVIPGVVAVLAAALALALRTGHFYVGHILGSRGGTRQSILRWSYLVLWTLPAFALFGFVTFSPQFFATLEYLDVHANLTPLLYGLLVVFPFPLAALPLLVPGQNPPEVSALPLLFFAGVYLGITAWLLTWLLRAPRAFTRATAVDAASPALPGLTGLRPASIPTAVLRKDLQVASRTPGFAFLLLLPLLDAVAIGVWSFLGSPTAHDVLSIGAAAVGSSALLATFFAPAFFAIEVFGFSYTRSLPLPRDELLAGKVRLVLLVYVAATLLVLGITALAIPTVYVVNSFAFFALAELPAILAAALLEFGLLFRKAARSGLPITSLYAGAGWVLAVSIPGLVVAGAPLVTLEYLRNAGPAGLALLPIMAAISLAELGVVAPVTLRSLGRGSL